MNETLLHRKLDRQQQQIADLEHLIEERSRSLFAAKEGLEATNRFLANVLATLRCAVLVVDNDGRIVRANAAAQQLFGDAACAADARPFRALVPADVLGDPLQLTEGEVELLGRDGTRMPVLFAASPLANEQGSVVGTVCIAYDIREKKRLELELRHAQKLESVGQLAAGIAHEINTPVQFAGDSVVFLDEAMQGMRQVLAAYRGLREAVECGEDPTAAVAAVAEAEAGADLEFLVSEAPAAIRRAGEGMNRIATIVKAMKAFAHPGDTAMAPADLNDAIRTTLEVCRNEYKYVADVALELGPLPPVQCNSGDINQVILNLVVNAAHAIEEKVAGTGRRGRIVVRTRVDGEAALIEVEDTGGGIPDHVVGRIFDPFFTTKPVGKGSGQGLPIVRNIVVDRHRGELTFATVVGQGTTFVVRLPIRAAENTRV